MWTMYNERTFKHHCVIYYDDDCMVIHARPPPPSHTRDICPSFSTLITIDIVVSINQEVTWTHTSTHTLTYKYVHILHTQSPDLCPTHTRARFRGTDDNNVTTAMYSSSSSSTRPSSGAQACTCTQRWITFLIIKCWRYIIHIYII